MDDIGYMNDTLYYSYDSICETCEWFSEPHALSMCFSLYLVLLYHWWASIKISADGEYFLKEENKLLASGEYRFDHSEWAAYHRLWSCAIWIGHLQLAGLINNLDADHLLNAASCSSEKEIFIKLFINLKTNYNLNFFLGWPQGTQGWWYKQCGSHEWADFSASGRAGGSSRRTKVTSTTKVTIAGYVILIWPWLFHTGKQK